jgi:hypothetical protein
MACVTLRDFEALLAGQLATAGSLTVGSMLKSVIISKII